MKQTLLGFVLLLVPISSTIAEGAQSQTAERGKIVEAVDIDGVIDEEMLSPTLQQDLHKLVGQPYDAQTATELAERIRKELPRFVSASTVAPGAEPDSVRVVFVVSRFIVESVDIDGIARSRVSDELYADMQKMVGVPIDQNRVRRLRDRLIAELGSRYGVEQVTQRGAAQQVKVLFHAYVIPWLPFRDPGWFLAYHQKQGISASVYVPINLGIRKTISLGSPVREQASTKRFIIGAANSADELIERYSGVRFGYEQLRAGFDRVGFKVNFTSFDSFWQPTTESASRQAPAPAELYKSRSTFEPSLAFAFTRSLYAAAGIQLTSLEMKEPASGSRAARSATGSLRYRQTFTPGKIDHTVNAAYEARTATPALGSDFTYTRHFVEGRYSLSRDANSVTVAVMGGRISGNAPMYDRFSVGNTATLRGWNKFDLAPLGGSRLAYGSFEYSLRLRGRGLRGLRQAGVYYDAGAVWNPGDPIQMRSAVGIRVLSFIRVGFGIRGSHLTPTLILFR
jgi:hypothetical protein